MSGNDEYDMIRNKTTYTTQHEDGVEGEQQDDVDEDVERDRECRRFVPVHNDTERFFSFIFISSMTAEHTKKSDTGLEDDVCPRISHFRAIRLDFVTSPAKRFN